MRVRCASGSPVRAAGVDSPVTAANGRASPATSTPITPATATITPRWDTTLANLRRSVLRGDMNTRVRDQVVSIRLPQRDLAVTLPVRSAWRPNQRGIARTDYSAASGPLRSGHVHPVSALAR